VVAVVCAILTGALALAPAASAQTPLSIGIVGNHFVNGAGQTIRLLGVNHASFEYACNFGYAYDDGHMDDADAAAVASWNASAVRLPLNEDCWLGINGEPSNSQEPDPPLTAAGYRQAVESYVAALNAHGLYAILDLHWTAPGSLAADGQRPMPDAHSVEFWTSVASTFKSNPAVVFDLFNEPYSPAAVNDPGHPVSWECWENGGCAVPSSNDQTEPPTGLYQAVGMQALVDAVRATGATQPVMVGGLSYANDLSQWLENAPDDPLNQEAASFHNYQGEGCDDPTCWNATIAAVAAHVPVVTGEFDQDVCSPSTFDDEYMSWADQHGVSYLAWGWWVLSQQEISDDGCAAYYLLSDYGGTPAAPNGTSLHDHLLALPAGGLSGTGAPVGPPPKSRISLLAFHARVEPGGAKVKLKLRSAQGCNGTIAGQAAKAFAVRYAARKRHGVSLGTAHFRLVAGNSTTVVLELPKPARKLLSAGHSLSARFTLTLSNDQDLRTVLRRTSTLKLPAIHRHR
jgi:endoglucanase